jgi:hypothetical protein
MQPAAVEATVSHHSLTSFAFSTGISMLGIIFYFFSEYSLSTAATYHRQLTYKQYNGTVFHFLHLLLRSRY